MQSMKQASQRIRLFGLLLLVLALGIVVLGGSYFVTVRNTSSSTNVSTWQTYVSPTSGAHFRYPPSWHIMRNMMGIAQPVWLLETIRIQGPNGFQLAFQVQKPHTNPAMSCARTYDAAPVKLNATYDMVYEGIDSQHISSVYLVVHDNSRSGGYGCGLGFYANPINSDLGFLFYGTYNGPTRSLPEATYQQQAEVATAKAVFASFQP